MNNAMPRPARIMPTHCRGVSLGPPPCSLWSSASGLDIAAFAPAKQHHKFELG